MSDALNELYKSVESNENMGKRTVAMGNRNEQYSRKFNIKCYGLPEKKEENVMETVNEALRQKTDVLIDPTEVFAIHKIPGQKNQPQPILVKTKSADRKVKMQKGWRMVDDVTERIKFDIFDDINEKIWRR